MASMFDYVGLGLETPAEPYQVPLGLPVDHPDARLSSGYGRRAPPTRGASANHRALDIVAPQPGAIDNADAVAAAGGVVVTARPVGRYGNTVEIDHGNGLVTRYSHLDRIDVRVGDSVGPSQPIGSVGGAKDEPISQRGTSTAPHLDFGVSLNGVPVNPEDVGFTIGAGGRPTVRASYSPAVMDGRPVNDLMGYASARNAGEFPAAPRPTPNPRRDPDAPAPPSPTPGGIFGTSGTDQLPASMPSPSYTLTGGGEFTAPLSPGTTFTDAAGNTYTGPPEFVPGSPPTDEEMARIAENHTRERQDELERRGYTREGAAARGVAEAIRAAGFSPQREVDLIAQTMGHDMVPQTMSFSGSQMAGPEPRLQSRTTTGPLGPVGMMSGVAPSAQPRASETLSPFERDRATAALAEAEQRRSAAGVPTYSVDAAEYVPGTPPPGIGLDGGPARGIPSAAPESTLWADGIEPPNRPRSWSPESVRQFGLQSLVDRESYATPTPQRVTTPSLAPPAPAAPAPTTTGPLGPVGVPNITPSAPPGIGPSGGPATGVPNATPTPKSTGPLGPVGMLDVGPTQPSPPGRTNTQIVDAYELAETGSQQPATAPTAAPAPTSMSQEQLAEAWDIAADEMGAQYAPGVPASAPANPAQVAFSGAEPVQRQASAMPTVQAPTTQPELDLPQIREAPEPVEVAPATPTVQTPTTPSQPAPTPTQPASPAPGASATTGGTPVQAASVETAKPQLDGGYVIDPARTVREGFVTGIAPPVADSISRMGVEANPGARLGYSPMGGVAQVYDSAPDYVQVAATGPGIFGMFDDDFGTNIGARAERALADRAGSQVGRVGGAAVGSALGGMFGGLPGAALGGLSGGWIGSRLADRFVESQAIGPGLGPITGTPLGPLGGDGGTGGLSQASVDAVRGYDAEGRGGLF